MRGGGNKRLLLLPEIHWQFILPANWEVLSIKTFMRENGKDTVLDRLKKWMEKKREVEDRGLEKSNIWVCVEIIPLIKDIYWDKVTSRKNTIKCTFLRDLLMNI